MSLQLQARAELERRRRSGHTPIARLQLHPGQAQVYQEAKRFNILACGRRWGKTELGIDLALETLLQGYPVGWFAPTYKILIEAWDRTAKFLKPITVRSNRTERRIELNTGGVLEGWTLEDPDAGRSRKYKRALIDEAALAQHLQAVWEKAIAPTLTDYIGDAWFLSSTRGRNYFWQLYQLGQDPLEPDFMSWQMPTSTNPYMPPEEIDFWQQTLPEIVFAQEYLAEFTETAMLFRNVRDCITEPPSGPIEGHRYVIGVDWAQRVDFTVFCVLDVTDQQVVAIERSNQVDYFIQRDRLAALKARWNVQYLLVEENSIGIPNIEELHRSGLSVQPFNTNNANKAQIIQALMGAFERHEIAIPDEPILIAELESYEATRLPSGKWQYSAPAGMHDDTVIALALAWWAALGPDPSKLVDWA